MTKFGGIALTVCALMALTGCATAGQASEPAPLAVEPAAVQVPTIRQGDFLTEVKPHLSAESDRNDIQLLAAGYEACLVLTKGNKDAYREKILAGAPSLDAGLDQLVIAAGAKSLLCP